MTNSCHDVISSFFHIDGRYMVSSRLESFLNSLSYGKPLVITKGLSCAQVSAVQNAAVDVPDGDPIGLADGIVRMIRELPAYQVRAARTGEDQ